MERRKANFGNGVLAIDWGANASVHLIEWARLMYGWGEVISFEVQEGIYCALSGNIAISNCLNVVAKNYAGASEYIFIDIHKPNYLIPSSYGRFELKKSNNNEFIGQTITKQNRSLFFRLSP